MSVDLVGPDGREYHLESDDPAALKKATELGYRPLTADAPQTLGESLRGGLSEAKDVGSAALTGAVKGFTAGVAATGDEAVEREKALTAEEHPVASGLGELAGMLTSPINAVASVVEGPRAATVLGRLGQKVAGGAAVGSLYGAGNTVSDAALGDTQLTAEKLVAGAGLGALLGGIGGGIGGAIEEGAAKVLPKLGTMLKNGQSSLDSIADDFALKSFRNTKNELSKFTDEQLADVARVTRERGHLKLSPEEMARSISADAAGVGKAKGAFLDAAEAAGTKPSPSGFRQALDEFEQSLSPLQRDAIASDLKGARSALDEVAARPVTSTGKGGSGWRELDRWKQDLQAKAKFSKGPAGQDDLVLPLKRQLAGVARLELDRQLVPALGAEGQKFLDAKALYGTLKSAETLATKGSMRPGGFSMSDIGAAVIGGNLHPMGIAGALGTKFIREHGAAVAARIADTLAKSPALTAVAQSFAKSLPTVAPKLGAYGPALMLAAERAPALALAQHIVTAQADPEYAANARMAGLSPESADQHAAALGRATDVAAMHGALKAHDQAIDEGLNHVVKGTKPPQGSAVLKTQDFGSKQLRQDSRAAHSKRVEEVRRLATNPNALVELVASNTAGMDAAPAVTAHLTAVADRAVKYLAKQAEVPPKLGPMAREWTPTDAERHAFAAKLEAVQEPMSVLRHAARGTLTQQQLDAVAAVYPSLHAQLRDKALERLLSGEPVPYRARLMLSKLAGVDADGTTSPRAIAMNQKAIAGAQGKPSERMPAQQPTADLKLNQAERTALPSERRQLGREM